MSYFTRPVQAVRFDPSRGVKTDLFTGTGMFLGLNCYEPGQVQKIHAHDDADKFYYVISGRARIIIGEESEWVEAGSLVWAPAGVPHGVPEVTERTVMLVGMGTGRTVGR